MIYRKFLILVALLFFPSLALAQASATTHVFPQFADGVFADGSTITSRITVVSIGGPAASCNISLFGISAERLSSGSSLLVQGGTWESVVSRGQDALASGYARLDCTQPVFASLTYSLQTASGNPLGIATVPSAPLASRAVVPLVLNGKYRHAIALANNNDAPLLVTVSFTANGNSVLKNLQVPARSHYIAFVDDIFGVSALGTGTFEILANGSTGSDNFNITALLFDQGAFTNIVPAVIH